MKNENSFLARTYSFWFPTKSDSVRQKIGKIISLIAVVVLIISVVMLALSFRKYAKANAIADSYMELISSNSVPAEDPYDAETGVLKEYAALYKVNNDLIGYLTIPDTKLSYPVVKGSDNAYYLNHTLYKEYNPFGVPFADYRATITKDTQSTNITMYGHSAQDGSFFGAVKKYKDFTFYQEHPIIQFNTIYEKSTYKIIGFFMEDVSMQNTKMFAYHDFVDASSDQEVLDFIQNVEKRSYFITGVDVAPTDEFITLSTCDTEVNKTDFRVVLVARKVRPGEDPVVDVSKAQKNPQPMMPARWYKKKGIEDPFQTER